MAFKQGNQRILSLVRQLTLTGLIVFLTTLTVVGIVLYQVRGERAQLTAEQKRLDRASDELRHFAVQSRAEMQATLDSMEAAPDVGTAAVNLQRFVKSEIQSQPDPSVLQPLRELDREVGRLTAFEEEADNWRAGFDDVWADQKNQVSLKRVRDQVALLRSAARQLPGRNANGDDSLGDQLAELARLVEVMSGEQEIDALEDFRDEQINPLLQKISQSIAAAGANADMTKSAEDLRSALVGDIDSNKARGDGGSVAGGAFYNLVRSALLLRREREKLKTQSASLFEDVEMANAKFAKSAQGRTMALAGQMEATLHGGWNRMLLLGSGCTVLFLWLARNVSRGIRDQVTVIEQARNQAEIDRQTTHKLMIEQLAAAEELKAVQSKLIDASRRAGMAEIATGVLHNVGNVLNSVNVSSSVISDKLRKSRLAHLQKVVDLFRAHEADLGTFITSDPAGKQVPGFLTQLAEFLSAERSACLNELGELQKNIDHIKEIVNTQQSYAQAGGFVEEIELGDLIDDALRINGAALLRHDVNIAKELPAMGRILADKHKVLQILVNLISNAKHAMKDVSDKRLTLRSEIVGDRVRLAVADTGYGIAPENMTRIFAHGFTTKKEGHGFGLHSCALAAAELGGSLKAHSDGPGKGAAFTLELPLAARRAKAA